LDPYGDSFDDDFNGNVNPNQNFSSGSEAEFFRETKDSHGQDMYEVEWDLDLVPKKAPKSNPVKPNYEPAKKNRKNKKNKKNGK